ATRCRPAATSSSDQPRRFRWKRSMLFGRRCADITRLPLISESPKGRGAAGPTLGQAGGIAYSAAPEGTVVKVELTSSCRPVSAFRIVMWLPCSWVAQVAQRGLRLRALVPRLGAAGQDHRALVALA